MSNNDTNDRIAQWEKMAAEAPDGMALFSLGNAYRDAERYEDAAHTYGLAIEYDAALSRAYQLLGQSLIKLDRNEEAGRVLTKGYEVAAAHGDVMPMRAMGELLKKLGLEVPDVSEHEPSEEPAGEGQIVCRRSGRAGAAIGEAPLPGAIGRFIADHYCNETWQEWIGQGTKVINELRLDFSNTSHQHIYEQHMLEWLGFTEAEANDYAAQHAAE